MKYNIELFTYYKLKPNTIMRIDISATLAQFPGQALYYTNRGLVPDLLSGEKVLARLIPEAVEQKISEVQVGWYRFIDDTYAPAPVEGKAIKGVVAYFEGGIPQSVHIREEVLPYCERLFEIGALSETDGKSNTNLIIRASRQRGVKAPAAEWCVALGGYLPANEQWLKIGTNLEIINISLEHIGAPIIDSDERYWCSNEYIYQPELYAYCIRLADNELSDADKMDCCYYIRSILA